MGFFDRFRKRVKEVVDDTDLDALTAEDDSEEVEQPISETAPSVEEEWDNVSEIEVPTDEPKAIEDDEWDDNQAILAIPQKTPSGDVITREESTLSMLKHQP